MDGCGYSTPQSAPRLRHNHPEKSPSTCNFKVQHIPTNGNIQKLKADDVVSKFLKSNALWNGMNGHVISLPSLCRTQIQAATLPPPEH